jgi:hypothetical protein
MRSVRPRRRAILDLRRVTIGDYIVLFSALCTVISLFLPWFTSAAPGTRSQWAFTYSQIAAVVVIVFFLAALFLVFYPALSPDLGLPPLPFSTPLVFLLMGSILLLLFVYEVGKYDCIQCAGIGRGIGVWVGLVASILFIAGSIIKWGSRTTRQRYA